MENQFGKSRVFELMSYGDHDYSPLVVYDEISVLYCNKYSYVRKNVLTLWNGCEKLCMSLQLDVSSKYRRHGKYSPNSSLGLYTTVRNTVHRTKIVTFLL